jgi:hypothetical protein
MTTGRRVPAAEKGTLKTNNQRQKTMKKIFSILMIALVALMIVPLNSEAKPFWIKFKIGLFAKWSITIGGECEDGWGICLAVGDNMGQNFFGYDEEVNQFSIRIPKSAPEAKYFNGTTYDLKEDSPVDPKLVGKFTQFNAGGKYLMLKKGTYKVNDNGEEYIITFNHYLK